MNYNNAIEKTILFIESHLTASFTVEDAAREAGYSYYHLNRQFSAVLGESVGSYIKKRRLSHAARELIYTERRIIDIALDHGFESLRRPMISLIGEMVDSQNMTKTTEEITKADTLLLLGTTLASEVFCQYIQYFAGRSMVIIHKQEHYLDKDANLVILDHPMNVLPQLGYGEEKTEE